MLNLNLMINTLSAKAARLAPHTYESAASSGCTDQRPASPRRARAWDMVRLGLALNSFVDTEEYGRAFVDFVQTGERGMIPRPSDDEVATWEWHDRAWKRSDWHLAADLWTSLGLKLGAVERDMDAYAARVQQYQTDRHYR